MMRDLDIFFSKLLFSILFFFSPIAPVMIAVGAAIFLDTYFGIRASIKSGVPYKSSILRKRLCSKILSYQISIITFFLMDYFLINLFMINYIPHQFAFTKLLGIFLIGIEFSSMDEKSKILYKKSFSLQIKDTLKKIKIFKDDINDIK
jgi:hypothetical protein